MLVLIAGIPGYNLKGHFEQICILRSVGVCLFGFHGLSLAMILEKNCIVWEILRSIEVDKEKAIRGGLIGPS